jgi:uncharacterized protein (TIGR02271 family)
MDTQSQIQAGMTVFGSDGDKVGKIVGFEGQYFVVEKGFFFPSDHYIPTTAVASVGEDEVYLAVTKDEALNQGWDRQPEGWVDERTDTDLEAGYARADAADRAVDTVATGNEALRVPVYEEDIAAVTRDVERGAVRIEKELVTEDRTITVPVTEERIRVTRVDSNEPGAVGADAFEEGVIEVPVRGQEVDVQKTARKAGEVVVEKESVTRSEQVGGTVRREEVRVEDGTVDVDRVDERR